MTSFFAPNISSPDVTPQPATGAATLPPKEQSQGLICPNCAGVISVAEGVRIVQCPYCSQHSLVQGDRGILRWYVPQRVDRAGAENSARGFLSGIRKARDLRRAAKIEEVFLAYLPFWRVEATVAGWLFGRVREDKDSTKPDEHQVFESMNWNDAAIDVTEFGVHHIVLSRDDLLPFDNQKLHAEAMVFDPSESQTEAFEEARAHFLFRSRTQASQTRTTYENIQLLHPEFSLVYYPVWLVRYSYRKRIYQIVVDGVHGRVMYGKAPGNILYRAAALVVGLALGNLLIVDGTALLLGLSSRSSDDDTGLGALLMAIVIGAAIILYGYRQFRYGEEVEDKPKEYRKALTTPTVKLDSIGGLIASSSKLSELSDMMKSGMALAEELEEAKRSGRLDE